MHNEKKWLEPSPTTHLKALEMKNLLQHDYLLEKGPWPF